MLGTSFVLAVAALVAVAASAEETIPYDPEQKALDFMAMSYAAGKGHLILVQGLIDRGAPVNTPQFSGSTGAQYLAAQFVTPLQSASDAGHLDVVALLLGAGADPNWQCCSGETALFLAAANGHSDVVKALLSGGADPNLSAGSHSPLSAAREAGHAEIVSILTRVTRQSDLSAP